VSVEQTIADGLARLQGEVAREIAKEIVGRRGGDLTEAVRTEVIRLVQKDDEIRGIVRAKVIAILAGGGKST
jgi:hypothetical protein